MTILGLVTVAVAASLTLTASGHSIGRRADPGVCTFTAGPSDGDTCQTFADWWGITLAELRAYNPTLSCPTADTKVPVQDWCVEMVLPPATSPTTTTSIITPTGSPLPSPTQGNVIKTCTAWYKVVSGDGCQKIVDKFKTFALTDFYKWNPDVGGDCSGLPLDTYVCVGVPGTPTAPVIAPTPTSDPSKPSPTQDNVTKDCKAWYKVVSGDGCQKIVDKYKTFTLNQFYGWNPDVGTDCSGLPLNAYVCVGIAGTPTTPPATTTTPVDPSKPSPTQANVTKDCKAWYKVVSGDGCQKIVDTYKTFTLNQFYSWNPDVGTDCAGLPLNTYVCVGITGTPTTPPATTTTPVDPSKPTPTQPNVIKTCQAWYKVVSGDGCQKIVDKYKTFTLNQFYSWNPDVGTDCAGLPLNTYVCVGVAGTPTTPPATTPTPTTDPSKPSPTQPNVIKTCAKWYKVASGDGCQIVVDKYGTFTLAQFYTWNPDVGTSCAGLQLGVYVCVGIPGTPTTRPATTTAKPTTTTKPQGTITGTAKPTPVQTGVSASCNKWYFVSAGDGCQTVADKFSVTLANFYKWNPAIKTDCSNLPGQTYVCVGVK